MSNSIELVKEEEGGMFTIEEVDDELQEVPTGEGYVSDYEEEEE